MRIAARSLLPLVLLAVAPAQHKVRTPPSATAARCGSLIEWRHDLDTALADAKKEDKLVLWYVPTVTGSPMDRKPEIDRYMRGGPFMWPGLVQLIRDRFVALDAVPKGPVQKELGLVREKFIEPGLVVLDAEGKERARIDKLSTFNPSWIQKWLRQRDPSGPGSGPKSLPIDIVKAFGAMESGDLVEAEAKVSKLVERLAPDSDYGFGMQARFYLGAILCRTGRSDQARELWAKAAGEAPDQPWAWKCALEAEGHGPFWRGFEDFTWLGEKALADQPDGTKAPPGLYDEPTIRERCTRYLLSMQRENGGYDDSIYDFGGTDSLPNVWTAGTAIAGLALLESHPKGGDARVEKALAKIVAYALDDAHIAPDDREELLWAHVYRARLCARLIDLRPALAETARAGLAKAVAAIQEQQMGSGAWHHEYPNPFASASALLALKEGEKHGVELDKAKVDKGVLALLSCRAEKTGAFTYGQQKASKALAAIGAAGRMPLCESALYAFGAGSQESLQNALKAAFEHHEQLESTRKYDDHANRYAYGGFFFWYDMHARTEAIKALADEKLRGELVKKQRETILSIVEIDGCFVDSHELGKSYGTAMGLLCLALL